MKSLVLILLLFSYGFSQEQANSEVVNSEEAIQVVKDYFRAIENKDFERAKELSTSDYVIYEDGAIWNNDSLIQFIQSMPLASIEYEFRDFNVERDCNGAFINYMNHGVLTFNDSTKIDYNWIESAYVKKEDDQLKLRFLHSSLAK